MKLPHHQDYNRTATDLCARALLSVWPCLGDFQPNLSLVGGLVPRYLCQNPPLEAQTLDVDLGISIASGEGCSYQGLSYRLRDAGFRWETNRYVKEIEGQRVYLDFLTEADHVSPGALTEVEDIRANAFFGVERAVQVVREVNIEGTDLLGAQVRETIRICEAGPFLCLKLASYGQRAAPKDLFDIIQVVQSYDHGPAAAARSFWAEANLNPVHPRALQVLRERFTEIAGKAAVHYAEFCVGAQSGTIPPEDFQILRQQHFNTVVTAGLLLLEGQTEGTIPATRAPSSGANPT
jgi:hypothetical protein